MQSYIYLIKQVVVNLIICFVVTGCISTSKTSSIDKRSGKKLVVSESGNYGLWFPKSTTDPRMVVKKLKKNVYHHVVSHPGGSDQFKSVVVMHWIEREPLNNDVIADTIKANDYNTSTYYGYFTSDRTEPFDMGHWSDVEKVNDAAEIISDQMINVNDLDVRFIISVDKYLVKKGSSTFSDGYVGKEVNRYFAHAFLNNTNLSLEIYQPITGELASSGNSAIDDDKTMRARRKIEDFIQRYVELI